MIVSQLRALGWQAMLLSLLVCLILFVAPKLQANEWESVETPYASHASAIGGYANGCLTGAQTLPLDGEGYQVIRPQRQRYYGHPALIEFIQQFAASLNRQGSDDILIADMSMPRGGNFTYGHSSHQIGLDVDVWFKQANQPLTSEERAQPIALKLVDKKRFALDTQLWSKLQTQMIKIAALDERVARIFVSPVIKQHLCDLRLENDTWLNKVRPWWGHTYHMHVRLSCPKDNPLCRDQASIPVGNGCHELGWWKRQLTQTQTTQAAKANKPASKPKKKKAKVKPEQCSRMIAAK
ncbi:penicillin-insensitive murein endopeptidase [Shewanella pealeana]|uniref:Peptidase U6 penicillin-insensitive murein endopeptidase n=1 Tax=Shewanella pealeana (strain ATCC 700345 / ANG-SQ1) TaxID=398579 RepID=A8GZY4_SHEPA|nr:penicillin-insensitive murein endopeptidase [Shewanella pealeana]ABV85871.1 peptidase U6 penicillin-insensitive murein endopeptidase [Shewanella pealeana ATCC 700345]